MSNKPRELPSLRGEELYVPFVGAIIEQTVNGRKQVLIQTRAKNSEPFYNGCIEIPGGKMRAFEDIYDTVRREVKEECGLDITFIQHENDRQDFPNRKDVSTLIQPFCVTQMATGPFIGLIFLCRASGIPLKSSPESKEARWIDFEELRNLIETTPEQVYTAFLSPLKKYLTTSGTQ